MNRAPSILSVKSPSADRSSISLYVVAAADDDDDAKDCNHVAPSVQNLYL